MVRSSGYLLLASAPMSFPILDKKIQQAEGEYASSLNEVEGEGRPEAQRAALIARAINLASLRLQRAIQEAASEK